MSNSKVELLRFSTAGSVDDGKSTLIGRLLYDTKSIFKDQLDVIEKTSSSKGFDFVDLSLITDGLKSEREQGITIDVAYRYFSTPKRKFIIADTPGHIQYTRNMVTGASNSNLSIILIDARKGILEQTKRHTFISSLLGIPHAIVCINKMDLVDYSKDVFDEIVSSFKEFSSKLSIKDIKFIPISALKGDNVVERSQRMDWYQGSTLLYSLETLHISSDYNHVDCRFPVQMVIRPKLKKYLDFRGFAGRIDGGVFKPGDKVRVLPSGFTSEINDIQLNGETISEAFFPMCVTITLKDEIDIDRGDMIVRINNAPKSNQLIDVIMTWMSNVDLRLSSKILIKHTTNNCAGLIKELKYKIDVNSLHRIEGINTLSMNEIGRVTLQTSKPLFYDSYKDNRFTGSVILVDQNTNETLGAGMII